MVGLYELHFADSELRGLRWQADTLVLDFAAAQVVPRGPQADEARRQTFGETRGHVRRLALHLAQAQLQGDASAVVASAFGRVADGHWQRVGQPPRRTLGVPQTVAAPVRLSLALANGTQLDLRATALLAVFSGAPDYRESLAC
jgi:hypothetical protein